MTDPTDPTDPTEPTEPAEPDGTADDDALITVLLPDTITEGIAFAPAAGRRLWTVLTLHEVCGCWHRHQARGIPRQGLRRRAPCGSGGYLLTPLIVADGADVEHLVEAAQIGPTTS